MCVPFSPLIQNFIHDWVRIYSLWEWYTLPALSLNFLFFSISPQLSESSSILSLSILCILSLDEKRDGERGGKEVGGKDRESKFLFERRESIAVVLKCIKFYPDPSVCTDQPLNPVGGWFPLIWYQYYLLIYLSILPVLCVFIKREERGKKFF